MGKREQGESCPALSLVLREVDVVLVLLLFLNFIFLYVDSIFYRSAFVLLYYYMFVFLHYVLFVLLCCCIFFL